MGAAGIAAAPSALGSGRSSELELDSVGEAETEAEGLGEGANWALAKAVAKAATTVRMVTCRISDTRQKDDMLVTSCFGLLVMHVAKQNSRENLRSSC